MDDDGVGAVEHLVEIERRPVVATRLERWEVLGGEGKRLLAVFMDEVLHAPRIRGLAHRDAMPSLDELGDDTTEEVRAAVAPVRQQRVTEEHQAHHTLRVSRPSIRSAGTRRAWRIAS